MTPTAIIDGVGHAGTAPFKDLELRYICPMCGRWITATERFPRFCNNCRSEMEEVDPAVVESEKELTQYIGRSEHTKSHKDETLRRFLSVFQKQAEGNKQYERLVRLVQKELEKPDPEAAYR